MNTPGRICRRESWKWQTFHPYSSARVMTCFWNSASVTADPALRGAAAAGSVRAPPRCSESAEASSHRPGTARSRRPTPRRSAEWSLVPYEDAAAVQADRHHPREVRADALREGSRASIVVVRDRDAVLGDVARLALLHGVRDAADRGCEAGVASGGRSEPVHGLPAVRRVEALPIHVRAGELSGSGADFDARVLGSAGADRVDGLAAVCRRPDAASTGEHDVQRVLLVHGDLADRVVGAAEAVCLPGEPVRVPVAEFEDLAAAEPRPRRSAVRGEGGALRAGRVAADDDRLADA